MFKTSVFFALFPLVYAFGHFKDLHHYLFVEPDHKMTTEAFVLVHKGKTVYSHFEQGNDQTLHILWSMSKSITSLLFGAAQDRGFISESDFLTKHLSKELKGLSQSQKDKLSKIKMSHVLEMASGLDWNELYEADPFRSHVVRMLYFESVDDVAKYVLKTPAKYRPGTRFSYSSGDTNLINAALKNALPDKLKLTYPWEFLFNPLGIEGIFEKDASGTFLGSSYVYLKTADLVKIGQLILNKGVYQGKRVISKKYISKATSLSKTLKNSEKCLREESVNYGYQIWLNHSCPDGKRPYPKLSEKIIMFLGHGGQSIFVFPEDDVVAVRIARDTKEAAMDREKYGNLILRSINAYSSR